MEETRSSEHNTIFFFALVAFVATGFLLYSQPEDRSGIELLVFVISGAEVIYEISRRVIKKRRART